MNVELLKLFIWLCVLSTVAAKFIADAKEHENKGEQHLLGVIEWIGLIGAFSIAYYINFPPYYLIPEIVLVRMGFGNIIYNATRDLGLGYIGNTDGLFDKWLNYFPNWIVITIYIFSIFFSLVLQFNNF